MGKIVGRKAVCLDQNLILQFFVFGGDLAEDNLFGALCNSDKASESLCSQVAQGRLGVKNGKGFYEYSDEQKAKAQREFYKRLLIQLRASKNY